MAIRGKNDQTVMPHLEKLLKMATDMVKEIKTSERPRELPAFNMQFYDYPLSHALA
jgi:hypothetical protein